MDSVDISSWSDVLDAADLQAAPKPPAGGARPAARRARKRRPHRSRRWLVRRWRRG